MRAPSCGRLALPLLLLAATALAEGDAKGLKEGETPGNFMEDEQWLSSISQYSGKIKHWNRFRDVSSPGSASRGLGLRSGERASEWRPPRGKRRSGLCASEPQAPAAPRANHGESKQHPESPSPGPLPGPRGQRPWDPQSRTH